MSKRGGNDRKSTNVDQQAGKYLYHRSQNESNNVMLPKIDVWKKLLNRGGIIA